MLKRRKEASLKSWSGVEAECLSIAAEECNETGPTSHIPCSQKGIADVNQSRAIPFNLRLSDPFRLPGC